MNQSALQRGHRALALTDHDSVSGSMEFAYAANSMGLKAIHGSEVTLAGTQDIAGGAGDRDGSGRHLTLLVRDAKGWSNLGGFGGNERVDWIRAKAPTLS